MAKVEKRRGVTCPLPSNGAEDREIAAIVLRILRSPPGRNRVRRADPLRLDDEMLLAVGISPDAVLELERGALQPYVDRQWERYALGWERPSGDVLASRIALVSEALRFSAVEQDVLRLALLANRAEAIRSALDLVGKGDRHVGAIALGAAVRRSPSELRGFFEGSWPLLRTKVVRGGTAYGREELSARLGLADGFAEAMSREDAPVDEVLRSLFRPSPAPRLTLEDCAHLQRELALLSNYLPRVDRGHQPGVNILIHGSPGTGKTEFVRLIAAELGLALFEVPTEDGEGGALDSGARFGAYWACQRALASRADAAVLFDEVEDVFPAGRYGRAAFLSFLVGSSDAGPRKAWVNEVLETNAVPAFWLCNAIDQIDPAYLRRFDMVLEVKPPSRAGRRRLVDRLLVDVPIDDDALAALAENPALAPGHLERMARVVRTTGFTSACAATDALRFLANGTLRALDQSPLTRQPARSLRYRPELLNADADLEAIAEGLGAAHGARICLFGPSGSGKSAWAAHLAQLLDRPLICRRASDLLSMWVGQTEKAIAAAFDEARQEGGILLIDEADTFLGDRREALRSWELSQVNEMLVQMEQFDGFFIASTNLIDRLDAAALRRFDFKIRFGYLDIVQRWALVHEALSMLGLPAIEESAAGTNRLVQMPELTPGDFANVLRQLTLRGKAASADELFDRLAGECNCKGRGTRRPIGFVH